MNDQFAALLLKNDGVDHEISRLVANKVLYEDLTLRKVLTTGIDAQFAPIAIERRSREDIENAERAKNDKTRKKRTTKTNDDQVDFSDLFRAPRPKQKGTAEKKRRSTAKDTKDRIGAPATAEAADPLVELGLQLKLGDLETDIVDVAGDVGDARGLIDLLRDAEEGSDDKSDVSEASEVGDEVGESIIADDPPEEDEKQEEEHLLLAQTADRYAHLDIVETKCWTYSVRSNGKPLGVIDLVGSGLKARCFMCSETNSKGCVCWIGGGPTRDTDFASVELDLVNWLSLVRHRSGTLDENKKHQMEAYHLKMRHGIKAKRPAD